MSGSGTAILLVEDDDNDVLLIRRAFTQAGIDHSIQVVRDGDAAVAYLGGTDRYRDRNAFPLPGLMLLDLKLPRRTGLEVLAWARGKEKLRRLPIVVLTSSRELADVNRAYELGANSYLVKPVEFPQLLDMVKIFDGYWSGLNELPEIGAV